MTSDKRWENLPSMESLKIGEEIRKSDAGRAFEKQTKEREEHKNLARDIHASFLENVQKQRSDKTARQEKALQLQEKNIEELKKGNVRHRIF